MSESKVKEAKHATDEENSVPGTHAPASEKSQHIMAALLEAVKGAFPDCDLTVFIFDSEGRYNYGSTVDRADMNAVLRAHLARQGEMVEIDKAIEEPSKGRA